MKTRPQLLLLAGAAALALGACATIGLKRGCVSLNEAYIEIHPGTNISLQDEARLYRILRQYNSSLYKIRKTNNSQMTTHGSLQDVYIKQDLLTEVANSAGVSYSAVQIGKSSHIEHTRNIEHTNNIEHIQNVEHYKSVETQIDPKDYAKCVELVRRVTPILQNYSCNRGTASH